MLSGDVLDPGDAMASKTVPPQATQPPRGCHQQEVTTRQGRVGGGPGCCGGTEKGALSIPLPTPAISEEQLPIEAKDHHSRKTRIS